MFLESPSSVLVVAMHHSPDNRWGTAQSRQDEAQRA